MSKNKRALWHVVIDCTTREHAWLIAYSLNHTQMLNAYIQEEEEED